MGHSGSPAQCGLRACTHTATASLLHGKPQRGTGGLTTGAKHPPSAPPVSSALRL